MGVVWLGLAVAVWIEWVVGGHEELELMSGLMEVDLVWVLIFCGRSSALIRYTLDREESPTSDSGDKHPVLGLLAFTTA